MPVCPLFVCIMPGNNNITYSNCDSGGTQISSTASSVDEDSHWEGRVAGNRGNTNSRNITGNTVITSNTKTIEATGTTETTATTENNKNTDLIENIEQSQTSTSSDNLPDIHTTDSIINPFAYHQAKYKLVLFLILDT